MRFFNKIRHNIILATKIKLLDLKKIRMSIDTTNKFGFYDENTRQFYVIPATSEQEFKKFMEMIGMANSANKNQSIDQSTHDPRITYCRVV